MDSDKSPLWARSFLLIISATFLFFLAVSAFVLMPRQLWELRASDSEIGWVMGTWQLANAIAMPLVGLVLHRLSARRFMIAGAGLLGLSSALLAFVTELGAAFYALRAVQGLAFAIFFVSAGTTVVTVVPKAERARGIAVWGAGVLITQALAPAAAEQLLRVGSFRAIYLGCAVACGLSALSCLPLPERRPAESPPAPLLGLLRKPAVALGLVALGSGAFGFGTLYSFLSAYTEAEAIGPVAPFFAAYTVASLLIRVVGSGWADRHDRRVVIIPALMLCAVALGGLGLVSGGWQLALAGAVYGIGSGLSYPALMALVVDQAEPADQPRAVALDNWSYTLGMLAAAALFGPAAEAVGMRWAFAGAGALGTLAALALLAIRLPQPKPAA